MATLGDLVSLSLASKSYSAQVWAWTQLCRHTFNRVTCDDVEASQLIDCFNELADFRARLDENGGRLPNSESVGNWSRSFSESSGDVNTSARCIITRWLGNTDLLYRGLG